MVSHSNAGFNKMKHYDSRVREHYALRKVTLMFLGWRFQRDIFLLSTSDCQKPPPLSSSFKEPHTFSFSGFSCSMFVSNMLMNFVFFLTGVREEAMGWTMTLKDDCGVIAWTRRVGNYVSLFLLLSLISFSVQSDIVLPKDHRFSWKAGKMPFYKWLSFTINV